MEVTGQFHPTATLCTRLRAPSTHWIRGWVGPTASLVVVTEKVPLFPLPGIESQWSSL